MLYSRISSMRRGGQSYSREVYNKSDNEAQDIFCTLHLIFHKLFFECESSKYSHSCNYAMHGSVDANL